MVSIGKVRAIGVSNFTEAKIKQLINETDIVPSVNQVELHPYLPQHELLAYCKSQGILVQAYSPLGTGRKPSLIHDSVVQSVAEREGISPAQVLLSWAIQRETVPLVRTSKLDRVQENFRVKELSSASFSILNSLKTRHRFIDAADWAGHQVFD